jgi:hypothetical protein
VEDGVIVICRRWWAHLLTFLLTPWFAVLPWLILRVVPKKLAEPDWWLVPALVLLSWPFLVAFVTGINAICRYRVEVAPIGLRIIGNLYTHDLHWSEISDIHPRPNYRAPGYHVGIKVDGSRSAKRHWCNLWFSGYYIHPGMNKGGKELSRYLNAKRREWAKCEADHQPK